MKHSLIFLSLLTAKVLSAPIYRRSPYLDPDFGFDFAHYGHASSGLFDDFGRFRGSPSYMPLGSGSFSVGGAGSLPGGASGSLPPVPVTPPVTPAPVEPAPVVAAAPAPVDVPPAPVDAGTPAPVGPLPVNGVVASNPVPVDGAAPGTPPTFSEPPPLDVALASPGVLPNPSDLQAPGTTPGTPGTPLPPNTPPPIPGTPGTAADLGPIAAVSPDPSNSNAGATQTAIDSFNQNVAPGLEQGHPVDHSGDSDVQIGLDMMNKQHGGRSGITLGSKNLQVGFYRDFNPLKPLDTFDGSIRRRPDVLGIKAEF